MIVIHAVQKKGKTAFVAWYSSQLLSHRRKSYTPCLEAGMELELCQKIMHKIRPRHTVVLPKLANQSAQHIGLGRHVQL
jgi:hypothetical protein